MATVDSGEQELADTWKYEPAEPVTVHGYPITCPACGSADDIHYWAYAGKPVAAAKHLCVPSSRSNRGQTRTWNEPRVTWDLMRQHGENMLAVANEIADDLMREFPEQTRRLGRAWTEACAAERVRKGGAL